MMIQWLTILSSLSISLTVFADGVPVPDPQQRLLGYYQTKDPSKKETCELQAIVTEESDPDGRVKLMVLDRGPSIMKEYFGGKTEIKGQPPIPRLGALGATGEIDSGTFTNGHVSDASTNTGLSLLYGGFANQVGSQMDISDDGQTLTYVSYDTAFSHSKRTCEYQRIPVPANVSLNICHVCDVDKIATQAGLTGSATILAERLNIKAGVVELPTEIVKKINSDDGLVLSANPDFKIEDYFSRSRLPLPAKFALSSDTSTLRPGTPFDGVHRDEQNSYPYMEHVIAGDGVDAGSIYDDANTVLSIFQVGTDRTYYYHMIVTVNGVKKADFIGMGYGNDTIARISLKP